MGIGTSTVLKDIFIRIRSCKMQGRFISVLFSLVGPWARLDNIINKFLTEEYQFGLSVELIQDLLEISREDSQQLHESLSRNEKGR